MKRLLLLSFFTAIVFEICNSQTSGEFESYVSDDYLGIIHELPVVRQINGGTIFKITYEGEWTNELKGAFEHACKIWEEALPTCLPINITAKIERIRTLGSNKVVSKVTPLGSRIRDGGYSDNYTTLRPQMKNVLIREYHNGGHFQFVRGIPDSTFMLSPDIVITYNKDLVNEFSCNLDSKLSNEYDFVTLALRDIAKGLGFCCDVFMSGSKLHFRNEYLTRFETEIWRAVGAYDPDEAFIIVTSGSVNLY